jgi:hypothetical protein
MKTYKIASPEGLEWANRTRDPETEAHEAGDNIERDLEPGTELALVAAGWLEHEKKGGKS